MSFNIQPSNRHLAVARVARHDLAAVRRDLLRAAAGIQSDFRTIDTALPAVAQTSFGIYDDSRRLLVAVLLLAGPGGGGYVLSDTARMPS